jgi:N-formylglutamate deformylase
MSGKIAMVEARERLAACWQPYHAQLKALLIDQRDRFGMAVLIDCHSMPREAICAATHAAGRRPNVILGDRFGAACDRWLVDAAAEAFVAAGFVVARNAPFAGGYITQSYGRPREHVHALQIELDRGLYMDESRIERLACFDEVRARIARVVSGLAMLGPQALPVAAE